MEKLAPLAKRVSTGSLSKKISFKRLRSPLESKFGSSMYQTVSGIARFPAWTWDTRSATAT